MTWFRKADRSFVVSQIIVLAPSLAFAQLKVSADSLYVTDQNGTPVFLNGESAWCLFTAITYTDANTFLANCQAKGVNYLQTMLIEDGFTLNAPANAYGVTPFSGADFSTPREAYFLHCDSVINLAASYGIYLMLFPAYLGSNASEGWQTEISAASAATMKTYGRYVGARYRNFPNIVWSIGGDIEPSPWQVKCDSMAAGIRLEDPTNLMSTRDDPPTFAHTNWPNRYWLTLNGFYPYWGPANYLPERIYQMGKQSRSYSPRQPFVLQEAYYEGEGATQVQLRQQSYYGILGGAIAGQVYGNCPIWHFSQRPSSICGAGNWFNELESQGRINNKWVGKLFRSRYWYKLVPDTNHVVITAGYGTYGDGTYVTTSYASDSSSVIAYLPTSRTVTINPSKLAGDSVRVYWFSPDDGVVTNSGMFSKTSRAYTPPDSGDWVLVMDSKTFANRFDVPGGNPPSPPTVPQPPVLGSPPNGAMGVSTSPTLSWNSSTGAISYRLQVSTDAGFSTTVVDQSNIATSSYAVSSLAINTTYYWHVNATNAAGTSAYSTGWSFTTVPTMMSYPVIAGWNMISLPLTVPDGRKTSLFPTAITDAFAYVQDVGYVRRDTLVNGEGYWLKFGSAQIVSISGVERVRDTIDVHVGWNMFGSISFPVQVDSIVQVPDGIVRSRFFTFDDGYVRTFTIDPGKSYWVSISASGQLILRGNGSTVSEKRERVK